jgi:hypothetical protein
MGNFAQSIFVCTLHSSTCVQSQLRLGGSRKTPRNWPSPRADDVHDPLGWEGSDDKTEMEVFPSVYHQTHAKSPAISRNISVNGRAIGPG